MTFKILSYVRRKASGSYIVPVLGDGNRYGLREGFFCSTISRSTACWGIAKVRMEFLVFGGLTIRKTGRGAALPMRWTFRARAYPNVRLALVSILLVRIPAVWHMKREGKKADRNTAETWEDIAHYPSASLHNCRIY